MRWGCAIFASAGLVLSSGCRDYDFRLDKTIEEMKYQQSLEKALEKPPTSGPLQQELIFIRPPKGLAGPTKAFTLAVVQPGKFDLENSFIDESKHASLHVLARHKKPKATPKKGAKPSAEPGDFTTEVIELVKTAYGIENLPKFQDVSKRHKGRENRYKEVELNLKDKKITIYLYGDKAGPYNVALIFDYPKSNWLMSLGINMCLETFAVGEGASRAFSGSGDDGPEEEAGGAPAPAI